jgi:hypothetical protein
VYILCYPATQICDPSWSACYRRALISYAGVANPLNCNHSRSSVVTCDLETFSDLPQPLEYTFHHISAPKSPGREILLNLSPGFDDISTVTGAVGFSGHAYPRISTGSTAASMRLRLSPTTERSHRYVLSASSEFSVVPSTTWSKLNDLTVYDLVLMPWEWVHSDNLRLATRRKLAGSFLSRHW